MAAKSKSRVSFSEFVAEDVADDPVQRILAESGDDTDTDEEFREITSSEAESGWSTSGEEDAERLEAVLEGIYSCSPSLFRSSGLDPAERSSLLLLDKEIGESEEECKLCKNIRNCEKKDLYTPFLSF